MKLKALFIFHLSFFLLFAACGNSDSSDSLGNDSSVTTNAKGHSTKTPGTLDEERTFANDVWCKQSPEVFELDVADANTFYSVEYSIAIDTAVYRYETFPFYTDIYTPDGTHRHLTPEFQVKQYGRWKGEDRDGYRVITKQLFDYFSFNKAGKQRIEVKQATSQYNLEGVHAFSIKIQKANLDFEKMRNGNK